MTNLSRSTMSPAATPTSGPILVLGARGKTGRRVAARLVSRGLPIRLGSRSGVPPFDWEDPATWSAALDEVSAVYLTYFPDLAAPGAVDAVGAFARLAVDRDVPRIVLLAGRGEHRAELAEDAVRASGAALTVIRAAWFAQNFSEDYLLGPVLGGEVVLPAGAIPEPFVDADDIADVAVAALTDRRHIGQVYDVTGPRLLTFADAVAAIAAATGREIRYVSVTVDEYAAAASTQGVPDDLVEMFTHLFGEILDGRNSHLGDGVERVLRRAPKDFSDFARRVAVTGVWGAPVASGASR